MEDITQIISLNVGGRILTTFRTTLCKFPDSMIAKMFSPNQEMIPCIKGLFIPIFNSENNSFR